jgi:hypothetical protein
LCVCRSTISTAVKVYGRDRQGLLFLNGCGSDLDRSEPQSLTKPTLLSIVYAGTPGKDFTASLLTRSETLTVFLADLLLQLQHNLVYDPSSLREGPLGFSDVSATVKVYGADCPVFADGTA